MTHTDINSFTKEIEQVLSSHPKIVEAAAFPLTLQKYGTMPFAAVRTHTQVSEKELQTLCREKFGLMSPKRIFFVKEFPRNANGKILKKEIIRTLEPKLKIHQNRIELKNTIIPKIIHQSYHTKDLPDRKIIENIEKLKKTNPAWEYRFYDEEERIDFITDHYGPDILKAYHKINPLYGASRADFFRHLLVYKMGGVWLDIKSTIDQDLDITLRENDTFILSQWQNKMGEPLQGRGLYKELSHIPGGEFEVWHVLSVPNNPFIKAMIERLLNNIYSYTPEKFGVGFWGGMRTTGPIAYTLAIAPLLKAYPHRFVDIERDMKFRWTIYADRYTHRKHSKIHYTKLKEPVILPST